MRVFTIGAAAVSESDRLPAALPAQGFVWIACARREFEVLLADVQATLATLCGQALVDLHVSDLLNNQLPSHYDFTQHYDLMVFRRLAAGRTETDLSSPGRILSEPLRRSGPPVLRQIDTSPVGFAVFDRVLLSVHPADCAMREAYAARLLNAAGGDPRTAGSRLPASPADLMLRIIGMMVDGYMELRREVTRQLDHWQTELLNPRTRFSNWASMLDARMALHHLDEICEDQRAALADWVAALDDWPEPQDAAGRREMDLLKVRSRDVLEHIERVVHHVRRLENNAETAVQMHFLAQGNRTNDIMRTLTALTAIFLPLNLITGFFGMNFEHIPGLHDEDAFWATVVFMLAVGAGLMLVFWRRRYIGRSGR